METTGLMLTKLGQQIWDRLGPDHPEKLTLDHLAKVCRGVSLQTVRDQLVYACVREKPTYAAIHAATLLDPSTYPFQYESAHRESVALPYGMLLQEVRLPKGFKRQPFKTTNESLVNALVRRLVDLPRVEEGILRDLRPVLRQAEVEMQARLTQRLAALETLSDISPATLAGLQRLENMVADAQEVIAAVDNATQQSLPDALAAVADSEHQAVLRAMRRHIPNPIGVNLDRIPTEQLAVLLDQPIGGRLFAERIARTYGEAVPLIRNELAVGVAQGLSVPAMRRRLKEVLPNSLQNRADVLVRTEVQRVATQAHQMAFAQNVDVLKGQLYVATLDRRTCPICAPSDGTEWFYEPRPGQNPVSAEPLLPRHPRCRCVYAPLTKSWDEILGTKGIEELTPSQRASMNGVVPGTLTYPEWLAQQSKATQLKSLGPARFTLWQQGVLPLDAFSVGDTVIPVDTLKRQAETPPEISVTERLAKSPPSATRELGGGVNTTRIVEFEGTDLKGVFKPKSGEEFGLRSGIPDETQYIREVAVRRMAEVIGTDDMVPETVFRTIEDEIGSIQEFVPDAKIAGRITDPAKVFDGPKDFERAAGFDFLIGNTDRHTGNWMLTGEGKIVLIDHGLSLPIFDDEMIGFLGITSRFTKEAVKRRTAISTEVKSWVAKKKELVKAMQEAGIDERSIRAAERRLDLLGNPRLKTYPDLVDELLRPERRVR